MIRINLLGEKIDHTPQMVLQGLVLSTAVVGTFLACMVLGSTASTALEDTASTQMILDKQLNSLEKRTREVSGLEASKKLLVDKLTTIAVLKAKKHGPVHMLDDINSAVPDRAWLTGMKEKGGVLELDGIALDNQTVALFMQNLGKSEYFGIPELVVSTDKMLDEIKLKEYTMNVPIKEALQAQKAAAEESAKDGKDKKENKKSKKKDKEEA